MKKVNIEIPENIYEELKIQSRYTEVSIEELLKVRLKDDWYRYLKRSEYMKSKIISKYIRGLISDKQYEYHFKTKVPKELKTTKKDFNEIRKNISGKKFNKQRAAFWKFIALSSMKLNGSKMDVNVLDLIEDAIDVNNERKRDLHNDKNLKELFAYLDDDKQKSKTKK